MAKFQRNLVWQRANGCCEYCQLSHEHSVLPHEVDHIRAKKHRGPHTMENTCTACAHCNGAKGPNAAGYDPDTDELVPLFNHGRMTGKNTSSGTPRCSWVKLLLAAPRLAF